MKLEEYINKLENSEEDFEGGMLQEISFEITEELHNNIIESIMCENKTYRRRSYKRYISAAIIIIVVLSFGTLASHMNFNISGKSSKQSASMDSAKSSTAHDNSIAADQAATNNTDNLQMANESKNTLQKINDNGSYEITIDSNDKNIGDFLNKNGILIEKNIYKLQTTFIEGLNNIVDSEKVTVTEDNSLPGKYDLKIEKGYVLIEIVIR